MQQKEVLIMGAGLAGLTAAIHLSKLGIKVMLIEKNAFPRHKVCGEYISNEVLPYFDWLGIAIEELKPTHITQLQFSTDTGKSIFADLPLGGFGISRYALDAFLYDKAIANGCEVLKDNVESVHFKDDSFTIKTLNGNSYNTPIVLGAFGKRSNIDQKLQRDFIHKKSSWLAVKAHYTGEFDNTLVGLHNFNGGYCGVSKVEEDTINICYLADYKTFKEYRNIADYQNQVMKQNPNLKSILSSCSMLFDKPLTISQISFDKKKPVEKHILMIGDSAGLIHPLCGNGMAMAIHSAKIASETVFQYYQGTIKSRSELEQRYLRQWKREFGKRLATGRVLSNLLRLPRLTNVIMRIFIRFPILLSQLIKRTHGKLITSK